MGQYARLSQRLFVCLTVLCTVLTVACDRPADVAPPPPTTAQATTRPTVASLVPAITDILLQMGAREQIVGISNYDPQTPDRAGIARVGDYHTADWEQLTTIRPNVLVIPRPKQDIATVFQQRAKNIGITLVDVHIDRLDEIYPVITRLGEAVNAQESAGRMVAQMQSDLDAIRTRVSRHAKVRTLILIDESAQFAVGPRNFLDDLLTIAGGTNVAAELSKDFPKIDREELLELNPSAIIQLMPDAPPQVLEAARRFWTGVPQLQAVKNGRVYIHSDSYLLLPGPRVTDIARKMADDLHPLTSASGQTTTTR